MFNTEVLENIVACEEKKCPALNKIRQANKICKKCTIKNDYPDYDAVPGYGNYDAEIMLIGEAPGKDEMKQGIPFVGRAGQILNQAIKDSGLNRENLYLHNILSCRPSNNKFPAGHEGIDCCRKWLQLEIAIIRPKVVMAIGKMAYEHLMNLKRTKITKERGSWRVWEIDKIKHNVWFAPTLHPSYCMRKSNMGDDEPLKQLKEDLTNAQLMVGTEIK